MSKSFPGKTSDIPLPPSENEDGERQPCATIAAGPVTTNIGAQQHLAQLAMHGAYGTPGASLYYQHQIQQYAAAMGAQAAAAFPYYQMCYPMVPMPTQAYNGLPYSVQPQLATMHTGAVDTSSANNFSPNDNESADDDPTVEKGHKGAKVNNTLPIWGNEKTMNLNPLLLTNIQNSPYFKVNLYGLKTYNEVIDEIWYQVKHLEPWEKGSRRVSGQTGMCGSVRGVGAGGIVSTPFCILYKLYTLRLTRKQVIGLLKHKDSPFIRAIGFMYIRYTQPPDHLWSWYEDYLDDEEELDVKAGGGQKMTIGQLVKHLLTKLDWFSTLFPRIPVPIQKDIEKKMNGYEQRKKEEEAEYYEEGEVEEDNHYVEENKEKDWKSNTKDKKERDRSEKNRSEDRHKRSHSGDRRGYRRSRSRSPGDNRRYYQSSHSGRRHH